MKIILPLLLFLHGIPLLAQNLVPNPSFEHFTGCPDNYFQVTKAAPWFSPVCSPLRSDVNNEAVFFNGCNFTFVGVPSNNMCFQEAHTGVGYVGIEVISTHWFPNYRQYLETKLTNTLQAGKKYYFSMYFNLCNAMHPNASPICFNADSTGVAFSNDIVDKNPYCHVLPLSPDIYSNQRGITPSEKWMLIDGCYIAKGGENYITIGNFASEALSSCSAQDTLGSFIFVDDVSLIEELHKSTDTTLCPAETWKLDANLLREEYKTISGWTYQWDDGSTSPIHSFTKPGKQRLTVSLKDCFQDVYDYDIKFTPECACQVDVPNAFTPNGDGLNDIFYAHVNCKTIDMHNYSFSVYNRWGQKVFHTTDKNAGWDGKHKGIIMSNQTFGWVIEYDVLKGVGAGHKHLSGTVMTLK